MDVRFTLQWTGIKLFDLIQPRSKSSRLRQRNERMKLGTRSFFRTLNLLLLGKMLVLFVGLLLLSQSKCSCFWRRGRIEWRHFCYRCVGKFVMETLSVMQVCVYELDLVIGPAKRLGFSNTYYFGFVTQSSNGPELVLEDCRRV